MGLLDGLFSRPASGSATESTTVTVAANGVLQGEEVEQYAVLNVQQTSAHTLVGRRRTTGMPAQQLVVNTSAYDLILAHQDPGAASSERFICPQSAAYVVRPGDAVTLVDDQDASRTRVGGQSATYAASAGTADVAGAITGFTTAQVVAMPTWPIGQLYQTTGADSLDTSGAGAILLECRPGAAAVDFVDVYDSLADRHLRRRRGGRAPAARSTSMPASPSTDATAALENIISAAMAGQKKELYFDPGSSYLLTDQIVIPHTTVGLRFFSGGGNNSSLGAFEFVWGGSSDRAMFRCEANDTLMERVTFRVNNQDCLVLFDFDRPPATRLTLKRCVFSYGAGSGVAQYGFGIGAESGTANANLEEVQLIDCCWYGVREADIWIRNGQPYGIKVIRPTFHNYRWPGPVGRAVLIDESRCTVEIDSAAWGTKSVGIHNRADAQVVVHGMQDGEHMKRLYWGTAGGNVGKPFVMRGGRLGVLNAYGVAAESPAIDANDDAYIVAQGVSPIELHSLNAIANYQERWHISVAKETPVALINCLLPNARPVRRNIASSLAASRQSGGTTIRGCFALASPAEQALVPGDAWVQVADRDGPENPGGSAILSGASTAVDVGFSPSELTVPEVHVWEESVSGAPAAGSLVVENRTLRGCVVRRTAAPGSGASVRVHWGLRLPRAGRVQQQSVESAFAADAVMGTAIGAGPVGTTSYWWAFAVHNFSSAAPVTQRSVCSYRAPGAFTGWSLIHYGPQLMFSLTGDANSYGTLAFPANSTGIFVATYDGATLRTYHDGLAGATVSIASWTTVPTSRFQVGVDPRFGWANDSSALLSACFGTGVPSAEQIAAHAIECREWGHVRPFAGAGLAAQHRYVFDGGGAASDLIGSAHVSLVSGTAPTPRVVAPSWGA